MLNHRDIIVSFIILCLSYHCRTLIGSEPATDQKNFLVPEPILADFESVEMLLHKTETSPTYQLYCGDSLFLSGNLMQALPYYSQGLNLARKYHHSWLIALFSNRMGFTHYWLRNYQEAGNMYYQSLEQLKQTHEIRDSLIMLESLVFYRICNDMLPVTGNEYSLNELFKYAEADPGEKSPLRKAKFYLLKALWQSQEMNFYAEESYLHEAEKSISAAYRNQEFWLFLIRYYQANYYSSIADYELADEFVTELAAQVEASNNLSFFSYFISVIQCDINSRKENYRNAAIDAEKIVTYIRGRQHPSYYYDNLLLGWVYQNTGHFEMALEYYNRAKELLDIHSIKDRRMIAVYWYLAYFYQFAYSDAEKSYHFLRLALDLLNDQPNLYLESFIYSDLGNYYYRKEDYAGAIRIYNLLLHDLDRLLSDEEYFRMKYPFLVRSRYLYILRRRGLAYFFSSKTNNYELTSLRSSYTDFKDLNYLQKKLLEEEGFEESILNDLKEIRRQSNSLLNVGYTLYEECQNDSILYELFEISQDSKAYLYRKYTTDDLAKRMAGIPERLIEQAKAIQKQIDTLQYTLGSNDIKLGREREDLLVNKILNKQEEYRKYIQQLEKDYPKYAELKRVPGNISVSEIRKKLDSSQVFIDYNYNFNSLYIFYMDKDTFKIVYQPVDKTLPVNIRGYRKTLEEYNFGDFDSVTLARFTEQSIALYNILIKPIQNDIFGKRLLIVPDGELNFIPFETLINPKTGSKGLQINYQDLDYLVFENPITYLYSASQLLENQSIPQRQIRFAGFAPDYSKFAEDDGIADSLYIRFDPLPGAYSEVESAAHYFKGKIYTGENSVKEQFFKAIKRNDIVHLAMHTILDEDEPMNSELIISTNREDMTQQLRAYEVYAHGNSASLVILSACNTGTGKLAGGEGILSIARAFLLAGVINVVVTQWPVADRSSATIMERYYYYLSMGNPTDVALQQSKIDFLTRGDPVKKHPYYWAPYVNVGTPFEFPVRKFKWYYWTLIFVLLLGTVFFIYRTSSKLT